jgi:hypothetical protein
MGAKHPIAWQPVVAVHTKGARMTDTDSGWRKRQIALDIKAENARELGLDYEPNTIKFRIDPATEVLRLSVDGIWVNPDVSIDDAAKLVLAAVGENIKVLVQTAVLAEREACAKVADGYVGADTIADAIRARGKHD